MTFARPRWLAGVLIGVLGISRVALASDPDIQARIQRLEAGLQPPVLVRGETPVLTPLAKRMTELKVPGMSVAVIRQGKIEWARGFGVKEIGGAPVTPDTLFQAASISKPVFALGVLHLVEQGKLSLDKDVNQYLKSWKLPQSELTRTTRVTLRRILSHSAGLTVHGFPGYASGAPVPSIQQILDGAKPANTPPIRVDVVPGTLYRYSGGGYVLAQQLLIDVTGTPLPKYLHDAVLAPLGMSHSTYEQPLPAKRLNEVALPYNSSGAPVKGGPHVYPEMAPAGLWTTPTDLAHYAIGVQQMLAGKYKSVISAAMARTMLTPVLGNHGLGPVTGGPPNHRFFTHSGANEGYRCNIVAYESGDGIVVMTNSDNGGDLMDEVLRTVALEYHWQEFAPPERAVASNVRAEQLDRFVGAYETANRPPLVVRRDGSRLVGAMRGRNPLELFPLSDHELFAKQADVTIGFQLDDAGHVRLAGWHQPAMGRDMAFTRMDDARARPVLDEAAAIAKRFKHQTPLPGSEDAARQLVVGFENGKPDYDRMSPGFASFTRQQLPLIRSTLADFGALKSLTFRGVGPNGEDRYDAVFEHTTQELRILMRPDGLIDSVGITPK
jgi:CubicO group peptidase (beta-lactamase class C family)